GVYDLVDGVLDRSAAYDYARASIEAILEEYPTIEVVIDLHRDGVEGNEEDFVTEIDGVPTSRIMFFNGLSRDANGEDLSWLPNSYLKENLAFSLQLQVLANAEYPGFTRKIYLQAERYNLHLRARSLLIEAGTQLNTVEEEQNAMAPIAKLIWQILS
ncbi:MAG: stage II sporulation protein P, partial [Lachnospiraceae bacterium]|nr:stage II sporulation protein P [Lachnospiraceae bacterium]